MYFLYWAFRQTHKYTYYAANSSLCQKKITSFHNRKILCLKSFHANALNFSNFNLQYEYNFDTFFSFKWTENCFDRFSICKTFGDLRTLLIILINSSNFWNIFSLPNMQIFHISICSLNDILNNIFQI